MSSARLMTLNRNRFKFSQVSHVHLVVMPPDTARSQKLGEKKNIFQQRIMLMQWLHDGWKNFDFIKLQSPSTPGLHSEADGVFPRFSQMGAALNLGSTSSIFVMPYQSQIERALQSRKPFPGMDTAQQCSIMCSICSMAHM